MAQHTPWLAVTIALCLHCASSTPPAAPDPEPPSTAAGAAETAEPEPAESNEAEPAPAEGSEASDAGAPTEKKSCAELDKTTCQITQGCAWNDVKKCVEEGASE